MKRSRRNHGDHQSLPKCRGFLFPSYQCVLEGIWRCVCVCVCDVCVCVCVCVCVFSKSIFVLFYKCRIECINRNSINYYHRWFFFNVGSFDIRVSGYHPPHPMRQQRARCSKSTKGHGGTVGIAWRYAWRTCKESVRAPPRPTCSKDYPSPSAKAANSRLLVTTTTKTIRYQYNLKNLR